MSTCRTVIVCLPPGDAVDWFSASETLDWHDLPTGTPSPIFPVRRPWLLGWFTRWSERYLVRTVRRLGAVTHAAGGRRSRLDLTAAVAAANTAAADRWRTWAQVVRRTPVANTWGDYLDQRAASRGRLSLAEATRRFEEQPRVLAMLAHNSRPTARVELDPYELDAYQAGEATYTAVHWQRAITGDAVITDDGRLLEPASESLADRLRFLAEASGYLYRLGRRHQVVAMAVDAKP